MSTVNITKVNTSTLGCVSVVTYEVTVMTGELWNAGTDAVVSLTMFGELGDTGSRQLRRSRTHHKMFRAGQVSMVLHRRGKFSGG